MIAEKLVLWHSYESGIAFDLSENRNHGRRVDTWLGVGGFATSLVFSRADSAVWVSPSPTLTNLRSVRAQVRFWWDPAVPGAHRHNLIEGQLSFALFIHPDGALRGTILNQLGTWEGATSAPGTVSAGTWHTAEFVHDGIAHCTLYLDGRVVAEGYDSPGPVRSVGHSGLTVGYWPEGDSRYTFEGWIDEAKVWCDDPVRTPGQLIDACCIDRERIARLDEVIAASVGESAMLGDPAALGGVLRSILDVGRKASSHLMSPDQTAHDQTLDLARRLLLAFHARDRGGLQQSIEEAGTRLRAKAGNAVVDDLWAELSGLFSQLPGGAEIVDGRVDLREPGPPAPRDGEDQGDEHGLDLRPWLDPWCLDELLPRSPRRDHREEERQPTTEDRSLDPDTDHHHPSDRWDHGVDAEPGSHDDPPVPRPGTPLVPLQRGSEPDEHRDGEPEP